MSGMRPATLKLFSNMQRREVFTLRISLKKTRKALSTLTAIIPMVLCSCGLKEPEVEFHCYICDSLPYHAPCVVNLSTGRVLELAVYDNDPVIQGKLAENQTSGYFSFTGNAGMVAMKDAGVSCWVNIPTSALDINTDLFCKTCLEELSMVSYNGVVLADLYDPQTPQYYVIEVDAEYSLRCYEIHITPRDEGGIQIIVNGSQ